MCAEQAYAEGFVKRASEYGYTAEQVTELTKAAVAAWQRSEGKNPEGGLNAKGRASYKKETGGTLKAPVGESNPKGERAKRQNSFCSRMCGMKSKNTGSKAQSDPDSRINKSLRKWNCKCGEEHDSLYEKIACDLEKTAEKPGLWANIRAKKARGGKPAKPGDEAYPDKKQWNKLSKQSEENNMNAEQAYIEGFVKRASEYGFNEIEAIELLKEANLALGNTGPAESYDAADPTQPLHLALNNVNPKQLTSAGSNIINPVNFNMDSLSNQFQNQGIFNNISKSVTGATPYPASGRAGNYLKNVSTINKLQQGVK